MANAIVKGVTETSVTSSSPELKGQVYNINSKLNVRSGASTNDNIIGCVFNNEIVEILSEKNDFYYIRYNITNGKKEGYASKNYIKKI